MIQWMDLARRCALRAIAAAATSAVPASDAAAADDHGDGASTWSHLLGNGSDDYHVDAKESSHRQWKAFGSDPTRRSMKGIRTVRILHARALLTRMQLEMYRGDRPAALRLLATLLREFMHLRAALAQAGFELLSSSANEHGQVLRFGRRFGRRMAMRSTWQVLEMALSAPLWAPHGDALDKPNRSTWQLLAASSTLRHDDGLTQHAAHRLAAAVAFLQAVLGQRPPQSPERTACMHDAELHGHLGLLMHAQLALAASSRRATSHRGVKDVGVKDVDDESEGQMGSEGQMESEEGGEDEEDDESEYGGVLVEESAEEGFVGEAELLTMAELEE